MLTRRCNPKGVNKIFGLFFSFSPHLSPCGRRPLVVNTCTHFRNPLPQPREVVWNDNPEAYKKLYPTGCVAAYIGRATI